MVNISVDILLKGSKDGNNVSINETISFPKEDFGYKVMKDSRYSENQINKILKDKAKERINELSIHILGELGDRYEIYFSEYHIKKINIKKITL